MAASYAFVIISICSITSNIFYDATYNEVSDSASETFVDICDDFYLSCVLYYDNCGGGKLARSA